MPADLILLLLVVIATAILWYLDAKQDKNAPRCPRCRRATHYDERDKIRWCSCGWSRKETPNTYIRPES